MDRWENFRTLELGDWHNIERRIGRRVPMHDVEVQLMPGSSTINLRDGSCLGRVTEVSVTGAAIEGASDLPVEVSSKVKVRFGDSDSTVTVRHVSPTGSPNVSRYGVEWVGLEDPLRQMVYGAVADDRPISA